jgi:hypothetical protein
MNIQHICSKHFGDKYLKSFIKATGTRTLCDVCHKMLKCVGVKEMAQRIEQDLSREYDEPLAAGMSYDKEEGEFIGGGQYETNELVEREAAIEPYEVVEAICQEIENTELVSLDWQLRDSEYMRYGWQDFQQMVMHRMRFVFFSEKNRRIISENEMDSMHPQNILREVGKLIKSLNIVVSFEPGDLRIFRARQHTPNEKANTAAALGAPPVAVAQANRMSPAGISMFYGAFDSPTCLAEVTNYDWRASSVSYGEFTNRVPLKLIDFLKPLKAPSLFNPDYNYKAKRLRESVVFLQNFLSDLQQPISTKKDAPHIEYVPTQIVCEYLRYMYGGGQVDGLIYGSVKNRGGRCVVLFVDNTEAVDELPPAPVESAEDTFSRVSESPKLVLVAKSVVRTSGRLLQAHRKKLIDQKQAREQAWIDQL